MNFKRSSAVSIHHCAFVVGKFRRLFQFGKDVEGVLVLAVSARFTRLLIFRHALDRAGGRNGALGHGEVFVINDSAQR